ncbi:MAG TPA: LamG domain-containing protein [Candidatus Paceibacterota bacterium]|nr:LamG domain-containing protein [Candidatus Paceibacterota bacterium]
MKSGKLNSFISQKKGFTLLEMLLVIAIIAILAGIVIVAINPGRQLAQARNAQRASDLNAIDKALKQYYIDNRAWPAALNSDGNVYDICDTGGDNSNDCVNLGDGILVPVYISALPQNPSGGNYILALETNSNLSLGAPGSTESGLSPVYIGSNAALIALIEDGDGGGGGGGCDAECEIVTSLRDGLVGYWPLDVDNSTQPDESDNNNTGSVTDSTYTGSGKVNGAYTFNGNGYIDISNFFTNFVNGQSAWTYSMWVYTDALNKIPFSHASDGSTYFHITSSGSLDLRLSNGATTSSGGVFGTNDWRHIVISYNAGATNIYYNGSSTPVASNTGQLNTITGTLRLGKYNTQSQFSENIRVDEASMWNRVLSTGEISQLYNSGSGRSLILEE